jgi:peptidoglycan-associated lipoprotein
MTLRQVAVLALVGLTVSACRKKEPEVAPGPVGDTTAVGVDMEQARLDSIAEAERIARGASEREQAAAVARASETLTDVIYFEYDSEQLTSDAERRLQTKISILRANPSLQVRVEGHADERGSTEYNLALGQRRAETVRNYFATYGIDLGRMQTLSYGEEMPMTRGTSEAAWTRNRRAEFEITGGEITNVPPGVR